jgi:hypothetical protein
MIDNKNSFQIYAWIRFGISSLYLIAVLLFIFRIVLKETRLFSSAWNSLAGSHWALLIIIVLAASLLFWLFEVLVKPAYIEVSISQQEIVVKTFNTNLLGLWDAIFRVNFKKRVRTLILSKNEYNNYSLTIGKKGFRKSLKLQKITAEGIFETPEINIGFLGQRKYTDLILAIDRLSNKINLN